VALRTVGVRLQAEVSGYMASLRQASRATRDFAGELDRAARAGHLDAVADQAGRAGLALVGIAGAAIASAAQFDKAMSSVQAATHASGAELEQLRDAAVQAGRDTAYSATEAAHAIEELAKAGVETTDILGGGLSGALSLAAAGEMDVSEAAEVAASTLTQFRLRGRDVGHVADLLAAAAGKAQGSVHDMSYALSQSGLVAAQMGMSVEDTIGVLAAFASAGLLGSDAGTSLKTSLLMLANPTEKSAALMQELGISVYDAQGQFVGIVGLAGQLQAQLGKLSQEQRNAALATIFGSDAIRAASILYEQGARGIAGRAGNPGDPVRVRRQPGPAHPGAGRRSVGCAVWSAPAADGAGGHGRRRAHRRRVAARRRMGQGQARQRGHAGGAAGDRPGRRPGGPRPGADHPVGGSGRGGVRCGAGGGGDHLGHARR